MRPSDLGLTVAGDSWRPGQWETIQAVLLSPARVVAFEGPPGSGKSLVARAAARLLDYERTHYLTGTIQLQEQYERDGVTRAVGRSNFDCAIEPVGAEAAICTVGGSCQHAGTRGIPGCDYYDQKRAAAGATEAVFNYAFWLRAVNFSGFPRPDFLVCDEAHALKDHVRSFTEVSVLRSALGKLRLGSSVPDGDAWGDWRNWATVYYPFIRTQWKRIEKNPPEFGDPEKVKHARSLHALLQAVKVLATQSDDDDWIVQSNPYGWVFRPVWVHRFVPSLVLAHAKKKVLLMSATILNKEVFTHLHGLQPTDVDFIRVGSHFDVERRPVHYRPVGREKRGEPQLGSVDAIRSILSAHPDDRVLVHSVSGWLGTEVAEGLRRGATRPIISHGRTDRLAALQRFRDTPGSVLVSPSMHTGVDLPDDLLRVQVILRLPFPDLGDPLVKAQMKNASKDNPLDKGQLAYNYDTAAALVQSYGRIMRSSDDHGTTYLLDPAWKWFRHAARDLLPRWFTEAVRYTPTTPVERDPEFDTEKFLRDLVKVG